MQHLWRESASRDYLMQRYHHIICDNVEEDHPSTHDLLREWLPHCESALIVYDNEAGYRSFLGADPDNAYTLHTVCDAQIEFTESFVTSSDIYALGNELGRALGQYAEPVAGDATAALKYQVERYYPEMLDWVAGEIKHLVRDENVEPGEIVVLAPFLSDALRFSLLQRLGGA